jgi:hypothetical protein
MCIAYLLLYTFKQYAGFPGLLATQVCEGGDIIQYKLDGERSQQNA